MFHCATCWQCLRMSVPSNKRQKRTCSTKISLQIFFLLSPEKTTTHRAWMVELFQCSPSLIKQNVCFPSFQKLEYICFLIVPYNTYRKMHTIFTYSLNYNYKENLITKTQIKNKTLTTRTTKINKKQSKAKTVRHSHRPS